MPYDVEIDPEAHIAYLIGSGSTDPEEGRASLVELTSHPEFKPGFALVCDVREMDFEPTAETMMAGFETVMRFRPLLRDRIAFVAGPALETPAEVSAALYSSEGFEARVFSDLGEAREWVMEVAA